MTDVTVHSLCLDTRHIGARLILSDFFFSHVSEKLEPGSETWNAYPSTPAGGALWASQPPAQYNNVGAYLP